MITNTVMELKDKLTRFSEEKILYDEIGNPIKYGDTILFSWISGRQNEIGLAIVLIVLNTHMTIMECAKAKRYALDREKPSFIYRYFWNDGSLVGFDVFDYDLGKLIRLLLF